MQKEVVSNKQAISIMVLFLTGTSSASVFAIAAGKDVWIAIILSVAAALITGLIFARMHYIFPGKNLFDILEHCFGKTGGKIIGLLLIGYVFQNGIDVLTNLSFFIQTVTLPETPRLATMVIIVFLCMWAVKEGIEVLGRWTEYFIPLYFIAIFIAVMLLFPRMDLKNIQPVLYKGIKPVLEGAFYTFTFPFGEIGVFTVIFSKFQTKRSPYKVYIISLLLSGILVMITALTVLLVLGVDVTSDHYYPSYAAVSKISIGKFLDRLEIIAALVMMLGGFVKVSIYLMATCNGIEKIFGYGDYRFFSTPAALLFVCTSTFFHKSILEFNEWNNETWPYLALIFQVVLPLIVIIICEIKRTLNKSKNSS